MSKDSKIGLALIIIGITLIIALSIWLGFPSPHFNRVAISIVCYIIGISLTGLGIKALIN